MRKFIAYILFILSNVGCSDSLIKYENVKIGGETFIVRRVYDERHILKVEEQLGLDSIRNGFYKEYCKQ